ncbi:secretin N-terminal domain-containing protein [Granulicella arctica]|uniref:secretin N-terminal domain-containing protein n=1 Tax=Granulicella arctica TaxID=940613 RepID=UPI0021DFD8AF|nr:secretin N-terminal domain-containing protein [Granulicella arctica]
MKLAAGILGLTLAMALGTPAAVAQADPSLPKSTDVMETFYLVNISQKDDAMEIVTAVRNLIPPNARVYLVPNQNAILVSGTPEMLASTRKVIEALDRPRKTYRLTYTITEMDNGKRIGVQHFTMVVVSGQRTTLKEGSKVPVVTGTYNPGTSSSQSQFTYLDVGMNFDATLDESANGVRLRTKVEQSGIAEEKSPNLALANDPIVRQTVLEGTSILAPGKPLVLGSVDVPGSTRHHDVEVVVDVAR